MLNLLKDLHDFIVVRKFGAKSWYCESDAIGGMKDFRLKLRDGDRKPSYRIYRDSRGPYTTRRKATKSLVRLKTTVEEKANKQFEETTRTWHKNGGI